MKIGILTFHRALNYGAILQCFAMKQFLKEEGYDVEVVDYRSPNIEKAYKLIKLQSFKEFVASIIYLPFMVRAHRVFNSFRKDYLNVSKITYRNTQDFDGQYDACVMGSDQVWSMRLNNGFDPIYWGNFDKNIRKVSYAASMGTHKPFSEEERITISKLINNFDGVAVRERSLKEELDSFIDNKVEEVLDPTFLVDRTTYDNIAVKPKNENYVLYYQQEYHSLSKTIVESVAKQLNCMVIVVTGPKEKYNIKYKYFNISNLTVPEFLGLFKYAKCVFTSSFHGTAFSIIFQKDFYFLKNSGIDRAMNLLRNINLLERAIDSDSIIEFSQVDYIDPAEKLKELRKKSKHYLLSHLHNK